MPAFEGRRFFCNFKCTQRYKTMKAARYLSLALIALLIAGFICSCKTHRDCRGKKKRAKTEMGGWL